MLCPTCDNVNLAMTDRQGIEIDYCPKCRGIWLDRGELDRIIERSEQTAPTPMATPIPAERHAPQPQHRGDRHHQEHRPKRPKSLLGELFDF